MSAIPLRTERLRVALARLCDDPVRAKIIATDAGLNPAKIFFWQAADLVWHDVINEAVGQSLFGTLVVVASAAYPADEVLRTLRQEYDPAALDDRALRQHIAKQNDITLVFPREVIHRKRFLSELYDSVYQAARFDSEEEHQRRAAGGPSATASQRNKAFDGYLGRLRFDSLLSETVVLTDTQLLDGRFFHELVLNDEHRGTLAKLMRRRCAGASFLEVSARSIDLEQALVGFVKVSVDGKVKPKLTDFLFSAMRDVSLRKRVSTELAGIDSSKVCSAATLRAVLLDIVRKLGGDPDEVERMYSAWVYWIDAAKSDGSNAPAINVVLRPKSFPLGEAMRREPTEGLWTGHEGIETIKSLAARIPTDLLGAKRTEIYHEIDSFRTENLPPHLETALRIVRKWYNRCYNRATAIQNRAAMEWISEPGDPATNPAVDYFRAVMAGNDKAIIARIEGEGRMVLVPEFFMEGVAALTADQFHDVLSDEAILGGAAAWWSGGRAEALQDALVRFSEKLSRTRPFDIPAGFEGSRLAIDVRIPASPRALRTLSLDAFIRDESPVQEGENLVETLLD